MRTIGLLLLLGACTDFGQTQTISVVTAHPREFLNVVPQGSAVVIGPIELTLIGPLAQSITNDGLRWQPDWDGRSSISVLPSEHVGRTVTASFQIPTTEFTNANNFTVAVRPRVFLGTVSNFVAFGDWVVVTLSSPPAQPALRLLSGDYFLGYGAVPPGRDPTLHGQKTDVAKVDVDRPPLIDPLKDPTLSFSQDGLSEAGGGDAEDTSLFPRSFTIHLAGSNGNKFAYAEFSFGSPDLTFHPLTSSGVTTGDYDDRTKGIDGRHTDASGEPLRIFTVVGERIANNGPASSDGKRLLFTGPLGGQR